MARCIDGEAQEFLEFQRNGGGRRGAAAFHRSLSMTPNINRARLNRKRLTIYIVYDLIVTDINASFESGASGRAGESRHTCHSRSVDARHQVVSRAPHTRMERTDEHTPDRVTRGMGGRAPSNARQGEGVDACA